MNLERKGQLKEKDSAPHRAEDSFDDFYKKEHGITCLNDNKDITVKVIQMNS